jgi:hypothetical protein
VNAGASAVTPFDSDLHRSRRLQVAEGTGGAYSKDPNYQTKVDGIAKILTELKDDEAFFSIDEFGCQRRFETGPLWRTSVGRTARVRWR